MASDRDRQIEELFAMALPWDPAEREARLRQQCADESIVDEVLRLLNNRIDGSDGDASNGLSGVLLMSAESTTVMTSGSTEDDPVAAIKALLVELTTPPADGEWLIDSRYEIRKPLPSGSFGSVLHAWDRKCQREVVLKIPRPDRWPNDVKTIRILLDQLVSEARKQAEYHYQGIVDVYDFKAPQVPEDRDELPDDEWLREFAPRFRQNRRLWIVMQYIPGESLAVRLKRVQRLAARDAARIVADVARALGRVHRETKTKKCMLHRDLKPGNILLGSDGTTYLTDFGVAVHYDGQVRGMIVGTLNYMSPRQLQGIRIEPRDELWSLGVILYEALTGQLPFMSPAADLNELTEMTKERVYWSARQIGENLDIDVPEALSKICDRCFAEGKIQGFSTANDLADTLDEWRQSDDPASTGRDSVVPDVAKRLKQSVQETVGTSPRHAGPGPIDDQTGMIRANDILSFFAERYRSGKLSFVVGRGLSAAAGFTLHERLLEQLLRETGRPEGTIDDLPALADNYMEKVVREVQDRGLAKRRLRTLISRLLNECEAERAGRDFGGLYTRIVQFINVRTFFTTNWDNLLERCLNQPGLQACDDYDADFVPDPSAPGRHLIYLHGRLAGPLNHLIVSNTDFWEFRTSAPAIYRRLVLELKEGTTLLCLGVPYSDLCAASYLRAAHWDSGAFSPIYAVLPILPAHDAHNLCERERIVPVSLDCDPSQEDEALAGFLDVLKDLASGRTAVYVPSSKATLVSAPVEDKSAAEYQQLVETARNRLALEGLRSASDWFDNLPAGGIPRPNPPPAHSLLHKVYVERHSDLLGSDSTGLTEWVKNELRKGGMAGITGLLGLGGVGKTYLAQRVALELTKEHWDVAWVSLHERGTEEALDVLAGAFGGLKFRKGLQTGEKLLALEWLFDRVRDNRSRTVVVLDNAEQFPSLPLLIQLLMTRAPVLVTSRTDECREQISYRRLRPMSAQESEELCKKILNERDDGGFDRLSPEDREDLKPLCKALGGASAGNSVGPLGVFAIAGARTRNHRCVSRNSSKHRARRSRRLAGIASNRYRAGGRTDPSYGVFDVRVVVPSIAGSSRAARVAGETVISRCGNVRCRARRSRLAGEGDSETCRTM